MSQTIAELQRFAVPGRLAIDAGCGGLPRISLATPACRGEIYLHGAHVTGWQPAGHAPVLWMGSQGAFADGKPIRGGIPLCWPWFGPAADASRPAHGIARLQRWSLDEARLADDDGATVVLRLNDSDATRAAFAGSFALRLTATFGRRLTVELSATNTGDAPFPVGEALHTYLAVGDVRQVAVHGLDGADGSDRVAEPRPVRFAGPITVAAETDILFTATTADVVVDDPSLNRRLRIGKSGSGSTVVWNPWIAKAARLPDFADHEWPGMLCVEAANAAGDAYQLAPGATHRIRTTVEVM